MQPLVMMLTTLAFSIDTDVLWEALELVIEGIVVTAGGEILDAVLTTLPGTTNSVIASTLIPLLALAIILMGFRIAAMKQFGR